MPARLFCQTGELAGSSYTITKEATIGRLSQNEVTLFPNVISSQHARIFYDENERAYFIEDLGSRNGTALDGIIVTSPMRLDGLNVITFANEFDFIFQDTARFAPTEDRQPTAPPLAQSAPRPAPSAPRQAAAPPVEESTRLGDDAFGAMPRLGSTPPVQQQPQPSASSDDLDKTRMGGFDVLPKLGGTPKQPPAQPEPEEDKTRLGDSPFGALPKLGGTPPEQPAQPPPPQPSAPSDDLNKTHLGGFDVLPRLGDTPPKQPPKQQPPEEDKTRLGDSPFGAMPNFGSPAASPHSANPAVYFLIAKINGETLRFHLKPGDNTIGRTSSADIRLPDASISRQHAAVTLRDGRVYVRDVGSKNGTFVNNERIDYEVELMPGGSARFGHQLEVTLIKE